MSDYRVPKGFEDRWRFLVEPRRYTDGRIVLTSQLRTHLSQFVRRSPQAIIKKASGSATYGGLQDHLRYISRKGELELEGRDGERLKGMDAIREVAADWSLDEEQLMQPAEISKNYVVSYHEASNREAVHTAGRAFARQTFGPNNEYLLVAHTDTPHPHLHITVRSFGDDGRRLCPDPKQWAQWRHNWVDCLQEQGLDAIATPRWSRGLVQRSRGAMAYTAITRRYEQEGAEPPRVLVEAHQSALRQVKEHFYDEQPWLKPIEQRHQAVVRTYRDAADELRRTSDLKDRELAEAVDLLVSRFPRPITRRTELTVAAYEYDLRHGWRDNVQEKDRVRDRERGLER
ncbi:MAG: relaxase/mobilization nuclease domain-containing protein [Caulobacter sp.]